MEEEHLFTTTNSNVFEVKDSWNDVDCEQVTLLSSSPAQRRCQIKGPQALPGSEICVGWQSELHRPPTFASPGTQELLGKGSQGKWMLWWPRVALLSCQGRILHVPKQDSGKRPYTFGVAFENPFQHKMGTKCAAGKTGEVRWVSLITINRAIWKSLDKWAVWDDLFSVMLLGDITVVNHKTINCCYSGIFLINTSILKNNSVKLKLLMGPCEIWQKQATKPTLVKISQVPDEICDHKV